MTADAQVLRAHEEITNAGVSADRERLQEIATLAEARLDALSVGRGEAPAHVVAEREAWRQVHSRALRVLARTFWEAS